MHTEQFHSPTRSYASQKLCECDLCVKAQNNKPKKQQVEYCIDIALPNEIAYKFICDQIVNSPIVDKLTFNIIDTFFFDGKRISDHYHNDEHGKMIKSHVSGLEEIERILRDHKYVPHCPSQKTQRKIETAKETVNRKIKNNIGIMVLNDGTYKFLNELNISYEIHMMKNVSFIKCYHTFKLVPVYYKHQEMKNKQMYKRARVYLRTLNKQITPFEINYIRKEDEYFYEQDLYNQDIQKYLTYLTCKICQLILMQQNYLVRSGVFVWAIDNDSAAVYIGNAHQIRYTIEKNPNQMLDKFMNSKKQRIERKLQSIDKKVFKHKPDNRVLGFEEFLKESFRITMNELAPKIDHNQRQHVDVDEAFKKLHPEMKYNLSDIIGNNNKFDMEMKKIFQNKPHKNKQKSKKDVLTNRNQRERNLTIHTTHTLESSRTNPKHRTIRAESLTRRQDSGFLRDNFKIRTSRVPRVPRIRTQPSYNKLKL